jgi:hypothetical protein
MKSLEIERKEVKTNNKINKDFPYFLDEKNRPPNPRALAMRMRMKEYSLNLARLKLLASLESKRLGPGKVTGINSRPVRKRTLFPLEIFFDRSDMRVPTSARNRTGLY